MRTAYYNEFDPYAAAWLRNLIAEGLIADGEVDERSIVDVTAGDLVGFTQCHFFAGIGGWSYALRLAGWPDDRPVWTGSCPCQPFSVAGKRKGFDDERHLWPVFRDLVAERCPTVVFGEQVASAVEWLAGVRSDLEALGYAVGAVPIEAASVGAPHKRDRFWFVADSATSGKGGRGICGPAESARADAQRPSSQSVGYCAGGPLADADGAGSQPREWDDQAARHGHPASAAGDAGALADAFGQRGRGGHDPREDAADGDAPGQGNGAGVGAGAGGVADAETERLSTGTLESGRRSTAEQPERQSTWGGAEWLTGADGKARRVEPGIRLLAHGVPARVGRLRAYGNAIVPQVAAEFIGAHLDCRP